MGLARCELAEFEAISSQWDALADRGDSPFLTAAWLTSWWQAFAREDGVALVMRDEDGALTAGGCFLEAGRGVLRAAVNSHSNDWGVVSRDPAARQALWEEVARMGSRRLVLGPLLQGGDAAAGPRAALEDGGCRLVEEEREPNPWLELPGSLEELLAGRSRNLRSQVGRRRRRLEGEGDLALRVVRGGEALDRDLDAFFALEGAGWKGRSGTAIGADPALVDLYRRYAAAAALSGNLRLYMLELNERLIAADYGCVFKGCGYLIKTAFDEQMGRYAPGLVLRAGVLESSIGEGLDRYDFLGGPDEYKLRWADRLRGRSALYAWSGPSGIPPYVWRKHVRPGLKRVRDRIRSRIAGGGRG